MAFTSTSTSRLQGPASKTVASGSKRCRPELQPLNLLQQQTALQREDQSNLAKQSIRLGHCLQGTYLRQMVEVSVALSGTGAGRRMKLSRGFIHRYDLTTYLTCPRTPKTRAQASPK
jgi:hypothetical protein